MQIKILNICGVSNFLAYYLIGNQTVERLFSEVLTIATDSIYKIRIKKFPMFEIIPFRQVVEIYESMGKENPITQLKQELNKLIKVGFEFLELKWSYKNDTFYSICIVSNKEGGILYDNIGRQVYIGEAWTETSISKCE